MDDDLSRDLDRFLAEVLETGDVPHVPTFLGEEWAAVAETVTDLLQRFERTLVIEVTRPDGSDCYAQLARVGEDIEAEVVSNEFLETALPADRVSLLLDLGWAPPADASHPNFSRVFVEPDLTQLAWVLLQTLHDVYGVVPTDTWGVIPAHLVHGDPPPPDDAEAPVVELSELTVLEEPPAAEMSGSVGEGQHVEPVFQMPNAVTISGRASSVTNSFVNSIIPVIPPTSEEIREALGILGMSEEVTCAYCGDPWTEWDHLRPIVVDQQPTGYISEIHNLVPACGKCNQSKGNRPWRQWMYGAAARSPKSRGVADLDARAERLDAYEAWRPPTRLDFAEIVGPEEWRAYWERWRALIEQMREATAYAARIRAHVAAHHAGEDVDAAAAAPGGPDDPAVASARGRPGSHWTVAGPQGVVGPIPKNRAVLEAVRGYVMSGGDAESLVPLLGASSFRSLPSELEGDELWAAFAVAHGLDERRRRLWFVDHPIHAGGRTWLLANNVWGPRTHGVLRDLVTSAGGTVTVTQPNGSRLKPFDNGEGMQVLPPGTPLPPKRPLPGRSAADDPSWSSEDRSLLATLVAQDAAWERVGPGEGLGSWTLQVAAGLVDQGLRVRPLMDLELSDAGLEHLSPARLAATHGDRTVYAFTDDHGQDDHTWARLKQRLGPYAESPAVDRVLADFSVHGPFERHVVREHGRVSVVVLVRLDDVQVALQDLVNVASSLDSALREAASTS